MDITETRYISVVLMLPGETEEQLQGQLEEFLGMVSLIWELHGMRMAGCCFRSEQQGLEYHATTGRKDQTEQ